MTQPTNGATDTKTAQPANVTINTAPQPRDFPEMPYSWNMRAIGPEGFEEQFTVRAVNEKPFLERVALIKRHLYHSDYKPVPRTAPPAVTTPANASSAHAPTEETPLCQIHKTPMSKRQGRNGQSFWSCPQKLDDGSWCPYRPK